MLGETVGNYRITGALSSGGMGAVFRAEHVLIGKPAAVKVLLPEYSSNRDIIARFFNEARATTAIRHPGIVEIFDFGHHASGRAFIVMELLEGESLASRLARDGRVPEPIAVGLARSIAGSLTAAHAAGIVHRDLKPDNVFLVRDPDVPGGERPKLLDFGIAKLTAGSGAGSGTRTGALMGTPAYMAPEQCRGAGDVDARADLYALGCILYEMVCGAPPFTGEGPGEVMAGHLLLEPPPPRTLAPALSPAVEDVIVRLLAKQPRDRFATADEVIAALGGRPRDADGRAVPLMTPVALTPMQTPTTLGGAASETRASRVQPRRARTGAIAAACAIAIAAAVGMWAALDHAPADRAPAGAPQAPRTPAIVVDAGAAPAIVVDAGAAPATTPPDASPDAMPDAAPAPPPDAAPASPHPTRRRTPPHPTRPAQPTLPDSLDPELPGEL
jgi:serine/threonine-protein kinase